MYVNDSPPEEAIMIRSIATAMIATATAGSAALMIGAASSAPQADPHPIAPVAHTTKAPGWANMLPQSMRGACKYEDSVNCYWDAGARGNHKGHSFIVRLMPGPKGHRITCVMYVKAADARKWDYCS